MPLFAELLSRFYDHFLRGTVGIDSVSTPNHTHRQHPTLFGLLDLEAVSHQATVLFRGKNVDLWHATATILLGFVLSKQSVPNGLSLIRCFVFVFLGLMKQTRGLEDGSA